MFIYTLLACLIAFAFAFRKLVHGVTHAPSGFEDEFGFHSICGSGDNGAALAYSGPERRGADVNCGKQRYAGPRRRSSDVDSGPVSSGTG
jgi:hypothetical protein